jgi:hypothetical protein
MGDGTDGYEQDPDQKVAPGASGPGESGYEGDVQVGDDGSAPTNTKTVAEAEAEKGHA